MRDDKVLESTLKELSAQVGRRLRRSDLTGKTVKLKIRWPDFTTLTRQATLSTPTDQDEEITTTALRLMKDVRSSGKPVRLIGVGVSSLGSPARQLNLFDRGWEEDLRLMHAVDAIRERFGQQALQRAAHLKGPGTRRSRGGGEP